jgi:serine/threonine protein kinase
VGVSPPSPVSASSDLVGKTLGHFRIVARLGEGGMGVVYRAIDERLRRPVALKVLPDEAMRDEGRRRRFMREARSAAAVVHSNVAAVHEVDESGGHVYIAMELVEGTSLRQELARTRLAIPETVRIAKGIARALAKAHEKGIVHRDLKPDNVMLNEDREVKVLDFGLAKLLDVDEAKGLWGLGEGFDETASHDTAGRLMGTPAYMSPEQATGKTIDAHSDVFSFGVILYEMLTGQRPFGGTSAMETLVAVARDEAPPAASIVPLPAAIELILLTCMQKKPELRYASGRELAAAIDAFDAAQHSGSDLGSLPTLLAANLPSIEVITNASAKQGRVASSKATRTGVLVALAALAIAATASLAWHRGKDHAGDVGTSTPSAAPAPKSDAATIFAQAEREEREGRHDLACADHQRASDADPSFARAAVRAAVCNAEDPRTGRADFRRAWAARATLAPNELAYLDAYEPIFQRDPEDTTESLARMQVAAKKFPDDPRIHFAVSLAQYALGTFQDHLAEIELSLRLDPNQPHVLEILSDQADYSGDFARGQAAIDQCLQLIPGEVGCLEEEAWVDGEMGRCAAMETDARRMLAVDPTFEDGTQLLANALDAEGSAITSVRELLRRKRASQPAEARAAAERHDEIQIDLLTGDFATAEKLARAWNDDVKGSTVASEHGDVARLLVMIEEETGRPSDAAVDAASYLDGRDGWEPNARFEDWAMSKEPTPLMLATRLHAGAMTQAAYDHELARTVARWQARVVPHLRNFIWNYAYAVPAETADEARLALEKRAPYEPLPPYTPLTLVGADLGRTYFLAGRIDDAVATLERATKNCFPVDHPLENTRAQYFLGLAREAKSDAAGACAAYGVVRDRWGHAKPRSVTAQKAMARMAALGCDAGHP